MSILNVFRISVLLLLLGILSIPVNALYARFTNEELIERSELIVLATLVGQTSLRAGPDSVLLSVGILSIDEVVKGDTGESFALLVLHTEGQLMASDTIRHQVGQQGLWFLRQRQNSVGLYLADHPQRFETLTSEARQRLQEIRSLIAGSGN